MNKNDNSYTAEQLLDEHGDYLFRLAIVRVRDVASAEDLVQETLLKAIKGIAKFRGESTLQTWLSTILHNEIASHFRSKAKQTKLQSDLLDFAETGLSTLLNPTISNRQFDSTIEVQEFWEMFQECLSRLPDHLLETFMEKWQNDETKTEEICKKLNITQSNFAVRMFRSRLLLRKCIEATWFEEPINP